MLYVLQTAFITLAIVAIGVGVAVVVLPKR
jgi:hypothetical protein